MTDVLSNRLNWGTGGHEREYTLNINRKAHPEKHEDDSYGYIFTEFSDQLAEILGDSYQVSNRGTRIEIIPSRELWEDRELNTLPSAVHASVLECVESIFGATELHVHVAPPKLKTLLACPQAGCSETFESRVSQFVHAKKAHGL